mmetsp:Transcript_33255/g.63853  ORF Transcript_33255/g.63853 Transcript_33255/m.63853 type:complete len:232 (+) Transcript_33255:829-1524(+)
MVRRTSSSASPRRPCESRRSASAWVVSGLSASHVRLRSSSSSHTLWASLSMKQSVRYTLAIAVSTSAIFARTSARWPSSAPSSSSPRAPGPASWRSSASRSSRPRSKLRTALAPQSRWPRSTYFSCPLAGDNSTLLCNSSLAPSASPSSARISAAASSAAQLSGSSSSTLTYSRSAPSPSPRRARSRARRAKAAGGGARASSPRRNSSCSHRRSGSCPSHSIAASSHSTSA